jgi:hypothetical protein
MKDSDIMIVVGALLGAAILATGQQTGSEWKLRYYASSPDQLHFTVERYRADGHWTFNRDVPLSHFRGLSLDTLNHGGSAKFEYVQDAGRLVCRGGFSWSRGSGSFTFVPNPAFPVELAKLGYDAPNEDQLFSMLIQDVGLEFARVVRDAGLNASTNQLVELRIHGVTPDYIRETQRAGYRNFRAKDYVDIKIHGVPSEFLRELREAGYDLSAQQVIELRIHGVNSEFMDDLKQAGYELSPAQITELKIHGVDSRFIRDLKSDGLQPKASDLVQFKIHGVTPEFLKELKEAGYGSLSEDQIAQLKIHGVSTGFIRQAGDLGYHFSPQDLTELHIHGVDAEYLRRLRDSGMRHLDAQQIAKLKMHGVD